MKELIEHARNVQRQWAAIPYKKRSEYIGAIKPYLAEHVDSIVTTIHEENGKLTLDALATEVLPALMALPYYVKQGKRLSRGHAIHGGHILMFNKRSRIDYQPYGVIGIISPWNYPFAIPFSEVLMALLAGNAVILKVASLTPRVGRLLNAVFSAAHIPDGLFNYIEMPGAEAGKAFIEGGIDKLFFTGSTTVGRHLMSLAASRLVPLVLELGGADPAIICADADIQRAATGIVWAGFSNAGQSCGGAQRILVHTAVYQSFSDTLCSLVRSLRIGSTVDYDMGPMASLKQKQTVKEQLDRCLSAGATIAAQSSQGSFEDLRLEAPAVVLTNIKETMPIMCEEVFGPIVGLIPFSSDEEALRIANNSQYGLTASVWSRNRSHARLVAQQIQAGTVMINDHLMSHGLAETPWGGFKDSGIGRTHGEAGFREMLTTHIIVDDILPGVKRNIFWQPYSKKVYDGLYALSEFLTASTVMQRIKTMPRVLDIFFRYFKK